MRLLSEQRYQDIVNLEGRYLSTGLSCPNTYVRIGIASFQLVFLPIIAVGISTKSRAIRLFLHGPC